MGSAAPETPEIPGRAGDRCLVLWFPGWPVTAWALAEGADPARPVAVVAANRVLACSPEATTEGVAPGQRRREAQSRCATLLVLPADESREAREFSRVVDVVERLAPGVQVVRPGVCALRSRGLARYVGSEAEAAEVLLEAVTDLGIATGRAGVADGLFAALLAAHAGDPVRVVPPGASAGFLAPLPVARLGDEALAALLPRLGVHTLGDFAALGAAAVRDRFGRHGERLHALARGSDPSVVQPRIPPPELVRTIDFEPPLTLVDQVAFTARATVEGFIDALASAGLACTELRVEFTGDQGELVTRTWAPPGCSTPRPWSTGSAGSCRQPPTKCCTAGSPACGWSRWRLMRWRSTSPACSAPARTNGSTTCSPGCRPCSATRACSPRGSAGAGGWPNARCWCRGDAPDPAAPADRPWPGRPPDPLPATVFAEHRPVRVLDAEGRSVTVDDRGRLRGVPTVLRDGEDRRTVIGWAGPWPVEERAWDPVRRRGANRFQVVDGTGTAWLLVLQAGQWRAEGRYD